MFFDYHQNNSGGSFITNDRVGQYVIIEASNAKDANNKAEQIGIYFDGCRDERDCSCCGDRWYEKFGNEEGTTEPTLYGLTLKEYEDELDICLSDEIIIHIYYKDGQHKVHKIDAEKAAEKNKKQKREKAQKLWGIGFNLCGLWCKKPVRLYETDYQEGLFYDKDGDLSVEKNGLDESDGITTFASDNKGSVEKFISGVQEALKVATEAVELRKEGFHPEKGNPYQSGFETVLKRLKGIAG